MNELHIVVAETMGTDGEFYSEVYPCKDSKDAHDTMCSLIADMAETMDYDLATEDICVTTELNGEGWWYKWLEIKHFQPLLNSSPSPVFNIPRNLWHKVCSNLNVKQLNTNHYG